MSDKPQTTRNKIQGVITDADSQTILLIHQEFINLNMSLENL